MAAAEKKQDDSEIAFNRSLLYHNSNAQNLRSWLSASLISKDGSSSADEEEKDELDMQITGDEGGLGFVAPTNNSLQDRQSYSANDKLRKQLLGNRASHGKAYRLSNNHGSANLSASKPKPMVTKGRAVESDDEAEGRTSGIVKKSSRSAISQPLGKDTNPSQTSQSTTKSNPKKRSTTYLDEVLAKRQKKKTKK